MLLPKMCPKMVTFEITPKMLFCCSWIIPVFFCFFKQKMICCGIGCLVTSFHNNNTQFTVSFPSLWEG